MEQKAPSQLASRKGSSLYIGQMSAQNRFNSGLWDRAIAHSLRLAQNSFYSGPGIGQSPTGRSMNNSRLTDVIILSVSQLHSEFNQSEQIHRSIYSSLYGLESRLCLSNTKYDR